MNLLDYDLCSFSADGRYAAASVANRLIIKKHPFSPGFHNTAVTHHAIDCLQWNNTSDFILCAQLANGFVQVYDTGSGRWTHTLKCGYFKFIATEWIGREKILITLEFHMALAVFDLLKNSIVYIEIPKPIWPCIIFDNDGTHMFVVSKINGFEKLLMMHSQSLDRVIHVQDLIGSCDGLNKSPDNQFLCIFNKQKLAILNFLSGKVIGSVEYVLLNTVCWAPNSKYLALGCSLGNIVVLASSNEFNIEFKLCCHSANEGFDFFLESGRKLIKTKPSTNFIDKFSRNIASIAWSFDCSYLSAFEINSKFLYIWENYKLIYIIEFSTEIKQMQWCLSENKLSVACGIDLILVWAENQIPKLQTTPKLVDGSRLFVSNMSWSINNRDMILSDGKKYLLFTI